MGRPAFLGLDSETNLQNYHSSGRTWRSGPISLLLYQCTCFKVGLFIWKWSSENGMSKWRTAMAGLSRIAEYCLVDVPSQKREQCGFEHFHPWASFCPTFLSKWRSYKRSQPYYRSRNKCSEHFRHFRHIEDDFIFHTLKQMYVPDLTCFQTLVTILVTDLFANTRHHRHWPFCEHSSSPSTYINRRQGLFFNADNTSCLQ